MERERFTQLSSDWRVGGAPTVACSRSDVEIETSIVAKPFVSCIVVTCELSSMRHTYRLIDRRATRQAKSSLLSCYHIICILSALGEV